MAADERLLAAIRRFIPTKSAVEQAYRTIFQAWAGDFTDRVVITGKSSGEDSANGEIIVRPEDFARYIEVLEARMLEYEAAEAGETATLPDVRHTDFNQRYIGT